MIKIDPNLFLDPNPSPAELIRDELLLQTMQKMNEWAEDILRNYAQPPIKGEITKGKIRWRGIRKCEMPNPQKPSSIFHFLEQRGKPIGYPFTIEYTIEYDTQHHTLQ